MGASGWNVQAVRAREAMSRVSDKLGPALDWGGVAIAHLDTGFTNHVVFNLSGSRPALLLRAGRNYMDVDEIVPKDPLNYGGGPALHPRHSTPAARPRMAASMADSVPRRETPSARAKARFGL